MNRESHRDWVLEALEQHEVALTRYAQRLLGDGDRARDVVQQAFLKLCEQSPQSIKTGVRQWLYAVCRNRALDLLRQNGRKLGAERAEGDGEGDWREAMGREPDPAELAEALELSELLQRLVRLLPAAQREAIDLWCDGFSYQEIAAVVGRKEGAVRVLVHRGLNALRDEPQVRAWLDHSFNPLPQGGEMETCRVHKRSAMHLFDDRCMALPLMHPTDCSPPRGEDSDEGR